ncbi:precorrin-8X methylmutase [Megasphaera micronuciformis]|uniref:Precorrin-8X methylmutase n=1 Tax=Megasphaera micronuciformis F0359 TaxID=706434 RepID=E2ZC06_9FIRM|nr:precorrin-8X methylmutase [Megasphaera micronuciformis]EFQ03993.1 precorrin-8X methylmutase [Megasphaera micronuciformis F0359]
MDIEHVLPQDIEKRSMQIIEEELGEVRLDPDKKDIIKRVIHTSADFEYAHKLRFSDNAVESALNAIRHGCTILTDTNMARTGINTGALKKTGGAKICYMADEEVAEKAKANGTTRATASMDKACDIKGPLIVAVGNAPTALFRLADLIDEGKIAPDLVIGVPVGFVNVIQAKERIMTCKVPYIVAAGRKGGSNVAAAIFNALLYKVIRGEDTK